MRLGMLFDHGPCRGGGISALGPGDGSPPRENLGNVGEMTNCHLSSQKWKTKEGSSSAAIFPKQNYRPQLVPSAASTQNLLAIDGQGCVNSKKGLRKTTTAEDNGNTESKFDALSRDLECL